MIQKSPQTLNICSDFHPRPHFSAFAEGFFVGLPVILWLEMTKSIVK